MKIFIKDLLKVFFKRNYELLHYNHVIQNTHAHRYITNKNSSYSYWNLLIKHK